MGCGEEARSAGSGGRAAVEVAVVTVVPHGAAG